MPANQKNIVKNAVAQEVPDSTSAALERHGRKFSIVWVVPILALILTAVLIWNNTLNNGPVIHITTASADGIEEGKTLVKMRSVNVGVVTDVVLAPDYRNTILTVQMDKNTDDLLRSDSLFWVVKPRIENAGISGLDTILSGSYIQLSMGSNADFATEFTALDEPPVRLGSENGVMVSLYSEDSRKLGTGDIVSYRGFDVGAITDTDFDVDTQQIHYQVFVREPFSRLVNANTKFWISSGIEFDITTSGLSLRTESLDNLVMGGMSFENFVESDDATQVADNTTFKLYTRREDARLAALEGSLLYVVMLENSMYGITQGSPVLYRGVQVGEVVKAPWFNDSSQVFTSKALPVMIAIDSTRASKPQIKGIFDELLQSNQLCAQIGSANLVFSNNQIELKIDPEHKCAVSSSLLPLPELQISEDEAADVKLATYRDYHVIPLIPTQSLTTQFDALMAKLNELDLNGVSNDLRQSLQAFSGAMDAFTKSNSLVQSSQVISKLATAFENFNKSVRGYGPGTPVYDSIQQSLVNIEQILKDIAPTMTEMGQNPSSLIFGGQPDPIPTSRRSGSEH